MTKTILITGSTDGIGKLAAFQLARGAHNLLIHGRSAEKLKQTIHQIHAVRPDLKVTAYQADFADLHAVQKMGEEILDKEEVLDVIINNAGVYKSAEQVSKYGIDLRFTVNYLAPIVLTRILLPMTRKSIDPRIINLSSAAQVEVSMEALSGEKSLGTQAAYAQSKLALTMWSNHLSNQSDQGTVIAVNPGSLLDTRMVREGFGRSWSSPDKGAGILAELAVEDQYQGIRGKYFDNDLGNPRGSFGAAHRDAYNADKIANLMKVTDQLLDQLA